ncbi:hypothetical protein ANO11243_032980 [Dothideomycetidae sp. 11243]|nr:hypothetical protein ANO11243_032980 [fungal sp. No.11243]
MLTAPHRSTSLHHSTSLHLYTSLLHLTTPLHSTPLHLLHLTCFTSPTSPHLSNFTPPPHPLLLTTPPHLPSPSPYPSSTTDPHPAQIPRPRTIQCLERRALSFQGYPRHTSIERLWTQRYTSGGHYAPHYDWASADPSARRRSSFMVYVQANCSGGGTHFPLLQMPGDRSWCEVLDCSEAAKTRGGVTFLPIAGAAVYWENFDGEEGPGWEEGLHAGMPVESGVKIGLNIWSWYQRGFEPEQLLRQEGREEKGQS